MTLPIRSEEDLVPRIHVFNKSAKPFDLSTALCLGNHVKPGADGVRRMEVYTAGGGFVKHVPISRLLTEYVLAEASDLSPKYRKGRFRLGDDPTIFEGYTEGRHWNGWACPFFSEIEFAKIRLRLWRDGRIDENEEPKVEDLNGTCFYDPIIDPKHALWVSDGILIRVPREEFTFDGQTFAVFDCGDMGYTWMEVDDEDEEAADGPEEGDRRGPPVDVPDPA